MMADKQGGKQAGPDDIMSPADMKPILASAKRGASARCAIGMTKDKDGVILLTSGANPSSWLRR